MEKTKIVRIAMKITEAIISILKDELNGKDKSKNADKKKKDSRIRKDGR